MPQIIVIGEALVEIMRPDKGTPLDEAGLFQGPFASGAPAIFTVAAARLGLAVGFIGSIGADAFGELLEKRLSAETVDTRYLQVIPDYTTGIAFIAYAADGNREFVFHLRHSAAAQLAAGQLEAGYFADVAWLHISGSTLFLSEACLHACATALRFTKEAGGKLSLDPNLRPELMPVHMARDVLAPYLEAADLLLPTAEEARLLSGLDDDDAAAAALLNDQKRIVVFKRGAAGASIFTRDGQSDIPGIPMHEIDPTGAGDCFNAAFVYGLQSGWSAARTGLFACAAGALAVTRQGPMEGAPTYQEVSNLITTTNPTYEEVAKGDN